MPSLSIIITAYNEADILPQTVAHTVSALEAARAVDDYEIIIIDDVSRDASYAMAQSLAAKYPRVKAIRNEKNLNQGGCFKKSIGLASKEYHCLLSGDDMVEPESLVRFFSALERGTDAVLITVENKELRHPFRRLISNTFVFGINLLFGLRAKYYNGPVIVRTRLLHDVHLSGAFCFMAETLIPLLKNGCSYTVVPIRLNPDKKGANVKALKRNFIPVVKAMMRLWWRTMTGK